MKRVTLADVARHCGVSKMTVSCVVRGIQCVKEETRKRVEAAIAELGYEVDPMLRSLAIYRTRTSAGESGKYRATLAYLDCDCDSFTLAMYEKAVAEARHLGYKLEHLRLPRDEAEQQRLSQRLWMQGIRGLLFSSTQEPISIQGFQTTLFAMVSIGAHHHLPAIDAVSPNYFQGLSLAASYCLAQGARRIALVIPEQTIRRTGNRWLGSYLTFCQLHRLRPFCWGETLFDESRLEEWVKKNKIDGILGLQGIRYYEERLPNVIIACLNDWQPVFDGGHIYVPMEVIAREAVGLLDHNLQRRRFGIPEWPKHIAIEAKWRDHIPELGGVPAPEKP